MFVRATNRGPFLLLMRGTPKEKIATGSYALVAGSFGADDGGLSNTMFAGEVVQSDTLPSLNFWSAGVRELCVHRSTANPLNTPPGEGWTFNVYGYDVNGAFASWHADGANFAFGDGHVEFLEDNIAFRVYQALSTRAGGEVLEVDPILWTANGVE